ncbi:MGH1-like glycoside hydrolase domain-containing protein [Actinopolymorpha pittospori]
MPARYTLEDFAFDLRQGVAPGHLWVTSGRTAVGVDAATVCGVRGSFAPPYAAPDSSLRVEFEVDGVRIPDGTRAGIAGAGRGLLHAEGTWWPHQVTRRGTYHQYRDGRLVSLGVRSTLTPLHEQAGYALRIAVRNRAEHPVTLTVHPVLDPGGPCEVPLGEWGWSPPTPGAPATEVGRGRWRAGDVAVELSTEGLTQVVPAGAEVDVVLAVRLGAVGGLPSATSIRTWDEVAVRRWRARAETALANLPRLETDVPGLDAYWRRSLASGLVCLWDHPGFVTNPFVATSGVDGGALCSYAWDTGGYAPHTLSLLLGESTPQVLEALMAADLSKSYAIAPDGTGLGVPYAYSGSSLVALANAMAAQQGISAELVGRLFETVTAIDAHFPAVGELCDYGTQHNLLEMRSSGWEHVVASPNAERAWSLDTLAALAEASGARLPVASMRERADRIRRAVANDLWDPDARWFASRYPDGHAEIVYSIQAFDALRSGACTPAMAAALLERIRPGAFLGSYGVSSVSAEDDVHYELGDVDWSGGGAYTGEGPLLALTLWERGESDLAWDVLRRLLWMGEHFPYFPQEHYCDRPGTPPVGRRGNIVAGLAGAEAILTGLAGLRPQPDGSLVISPGTPPGDVTLRGLRFRGHDVDVHLSPTDREVAVDGQRIPLEESGRTVVVASRDQKP